MERKNRLVSLEGARDIIKSLCCSPNPVHHGLHQRNFSVSHQRVNHQRVSGFPGSERERERERDREKKKHR